MASAGRGQIDVWTGGYPVWCQLYIDGKNVGAFKHSELSDLKYAVEKAIQEAYAEIQRSQPNKDNRGEMLLP